MDIIRQLEYAELFADISQRVGNSVTIKLSYVSLSLSLSFETSLFTLCSCLFLTHYLERWAVM
jgi:hypothetical protein